MNIKIFKNINLRNLIISPIKNDKKNIFKNTKKFKLLVINI